MIWEDRKFIEGISVVAGSLTSSRRLIRRNELIAAEEEAILDLSSIMGDTPIDL